MNFKKVLLAAAVVYVIYSIFGPTKSDNSGRSIWPWFDVMLGTVACITILRYSLQLTNDI